MRKSLRSSLVWGALLVTSFSQAQDRFAYAVTDVQQQPSGWNYLRKLNLQTGEYSQALLNGGDGNIVAFDAVSKKQLDPQTISNRSGNWIGGLGQSTNAPFASGVAAIAYDRKNNRIYYTPMFIDQLRYIDLKSMKVYYYADRAFTGKPDKTSDQGNIVTRMVIASDGNGYAMTNDATQLLRFSTSKKASIVDLGAMVDAVGNNGTSIHNSCSSYGGDMIADDDGNLYIFSARNHVFKINIETKVATHLGVISGLSNGFTVNGAAVNNDNRVVVASAMQSGMYFSVDMKTLSAVPYNIAGSLYQSSDLANSNLLATGKKPKASEVELVRNKPVGIDEIENRISIFPNPVTENQFIVRFGQLEPGNYTIQVTDVMGRQVVQKAVTISGDNQSQQIKLGSASAKGVYLVKVLTEGSKAVYSTKLVVQ